MKIISVEAIPEYPDSNLPTVLVYHKKVCGGDCAWQPLRPSCMVRPGAELTRCPPADAGQDVARTFIGMGPFGGKRATPESVALALNAAGPVCAREGDDDEGAAVRPAPAPAM